MIHQLILLSVVAQLGGPVTYEVADYLGPECLNSPCDIEPAVASAMADCRANPPINRDVVGCEIKLPAGRFSLSQEILLCAGHTLRGAGGDGDASRTVLLSAPGAGCVRVGGIDECELDGDPTDGVAWGAGAEVTGFACQGPLVSTSTFTVGIDVRARSMVRDVTTRGYVVGMRIDAAVPHSNANVMHVLNVHAWNNGYAGFWIRGPDANASLLELTDTIDNCRDSHWEAQFGECAGTIEDSFLGNTHVAPHAADNGGRPGYLAGRDPNNHSTLINPYDEGVSPANTLGPNSIAVGVIGRDFLPGGGLRLFGRRANALELQNLGDPANRVSLRLGELAAPGSAFEAIPTSVGPGFALRLYSRPATSHWGLNVANISSAADSLKIQMFTTPALGAIGGVRVRSP